MSSESKPRPSITRANTPDERDSPETDGDTTSAGVTDKDVDGDDLTSVGRPQIGDWTPGSAARRFELDAEGNRFTINPNGTIGPARNRDWRIPEE